MTAAALFPDLGPHAAFIWAAYAVAFAVLALLAAWIMSDERAQALRLAELESQGVRRRSAAPPPQAAAAGDAPPAARAKARAKSKTTSRPPGGKRPGKSRRKS